MDVSLLRRANLQNFLLVNIRVTQGIPHDNTISATP
jgi:hypothetical protein